MTTINNNIDPRALTGSMFDFSRPTGPNLLERISDFNEWRTIRSDAGLWPFSRVIHNAPASDMEIANELGASWTGVSLACQDYLGLTSHPAVSEAAMQALKDFGPHSAGSPALAGNTPLSLKLEKALGEAFQVEHVVLFPTGWAAGYATITGLIRPDDHIVIDQLAHASLQQGAYSATRKIYKHSHLDVAAVRETLRKIRTDDTRNGIMVVTEGLFSMDSDVPDLGALQNVCHEYGATLFVDVAHDFGEFGHRGSGSISVQNLLGKIDLVMGSFSKTFSSNGGFVATRSAAVRQYLKFYGNPQTFSNALSPVQTAVILAALNIVRSEEGDRLRQALLSNVTFLRNELETRGIRCIGIPSAIVPAYIGNEAVARIAWAYAQERGIHTNLVEFPAVAVGSARFRMQLMPSHTKEQLQRTAEVVTEAISVAKQQVQEMNLPKRRRLHMRTGAGDYSIAGKALPALKSGDLNKLLECAKSEKHTAGTTLVNAGEKPGTIFVVTEGTVYVEVDHQGQTLTLAECGPGQIIGEISLLDGKAASATVTAATDVEVASITQSDLLQLCKADPEFGLRLYQSFAMVLAQRLREQNINAMPVEYFG